MKICSTLLLVVRAVKINENISISRTKKADKKNGQDVVKLEFLYIATDDVKLQSNLGKYWQFLKKLSINLPYDEEFHF
jgi:hypothetical protein